MELAERSQLTVDTGFAQQLSCATVVAGHFRVEPTLRNLFELAATSDAPGVCRRKGWVKHGQTFDCMVTLRHPVDRLISAYSYFIATDKNTALFNVFGGVDFVNLTDSQMLDMVQRTGGPDLFTRYLSDGSGWKHSLARCSVVLSDEMKHSVSVLTRVLPYLSARMFEEVGLLRPSRVKNPSHRELPEPKLRTLLQALVPDIQVYAFARRALSQDLLTDIPPPVHSSIDAGGRHACRSSKLDYMRAVTYFGSDNPLTFINNLVLSEVDGDFAQIAADGFNTVILLVAWVDVVPDLSSPRADREVVSRFSFLLERAERHSLRVVFRLGYRHGRPTMDEIGEGRFVRYMFREDEAVRAWDAFIDAVRSFIGTFCRSFEYAFLSWEDFIEPLLWPRRGAQERLAVSKRVPWPEFLATRFPEKAAGLADIPIPDDGADVKLREAYCEFVGDMWWRLVDDTRSKFPAVTLEVRPDTCLPAVYFNMRYGEVWPPRNTHWAPYWGHGHRGLNLTISQALSGLEQNLKLVSLDGLAKVVVDQFNFFDSTPGFNGHAVIFPKRLPFFLANAVPLMRRYTSGYGVWAYRAYRQNNIYNSFFQRGLESWQATGDVTVLPQRDAGVRLRGPATLGTQFLLYSSQECDASTHSWLCFRMLGTSGNVSVVVSNATSVDVVVKARGGSTWREECHKLPTVTGSRERLLMFSAEAGTDVSISMVQSFGHVHDQHVYDVYNQPGQLRNSISRFNDALRSEAEREEL